MSKSQSSAAGHHSYTEELDSILDEYESKHELVPLPLKNRMNNIYSETVTEVEIAERKTARLWKMAKHVKKHNVAYKNASTILKSLKIELDSFRRPNNKASESLASLDISSSTISLSSGEEDSFDEDITESSVPKVSNREREENPELLHSSVMNSSRKTTTTEFRKSSKTSKGSLGKIDDTDMLKIVETPVQPTPEYSTTVPKTAATEHRSSISQRFSPVDFQTVNSQGACIVPRTTKESDGGHAVYSSLLQLLTTMLENSQSVFNSLITVSNLDVEFKDKGRANDMVEKLLTTTGKPNPSGTDR